MAGQPVKGSGVSGLPDRVGGGGGGGGSGRGSGYTGVGTGASHYEVSGEPGLFGAPGYTPHDRAEEFMKRMDEEYDENQRRFQKENIRNEGLFQRDSARSLEQQKGNYDYYDWNLAQDNPRGNLNQFGYSDTLRLSRLADMVNNRFHYDPGHLGHLGTGKKGMVQQSDTATISRWDPIETEEMRQMQANRRLDERAREAGIDLQSRIQAYPQEVQEMMDQTVLAYEDFVRRADDTMYRQWFQTMLTTEYQGAWQNYFQELFQKYCIDLKLNTASRAYKALEGRSVLVQQIFGQIIGGMLGFQFVPPNMLQRLQDNMVNAIMADPNYGSDQERFIAVAQMFGFLNYAISQMIEKYYNPTSRGGENPDRSLGIISNGDIDGERTRSYTQRNSEAR